MENKELEDKMANLYLDGYGPDGPLVAVPGVPIHNLEMVVVLLCRT
jgi:hypothetical protein